MRMGHRERGRDEAAARIDARRAFGHRPADLRDAVAADQQVGLDEPRRMDLDERSAGQDEGRLDGQITILARHGRGRAQRAVRGQHRASV